MDRIKKEELFLQEKRLFLDTIRHIRKSKGISLAHLEQTTGMSKGYISRIESGEVSPGLHNVIRLCAGLGVDLIPVEKKKKSC